MPAAINGVSSSIGFNCTDENIVPSQQRPHFKQSDWDDETMHRPASERYLIASFFDVAIVISRENQEARRLTGPNVIRPYGGLEGPDTKRLNRWEEAAPEAMRTAGVANRFFVSIRPVFAVTR